jgi:hypothetical protein
VQIKWNFPNHEAMESFRFKVALTYFYEGRKHVEHTWTEHYDVAIFKLPKIFWVNDINAHKIEMSLDIQPRQTFKNSQVNIFLILKIKLKIILKMNVYEITILPECLVKLQSFRNVW